jgi:hypothetical protein
LIFWGNTSTKGGNTKDKYFFFNRNVLLYFSLERKVPKVQERNDIQHVSFFRLDLAFVVSFLWQLGLDCLDQSVKLYFKT